MYTQGKISNLSPPRPHHCHTVCTSFDIYICRDIPEDVLNTYCWIHSTYTVVDAFMKKQGSEVPFPGIHNSQGRGPLTIKHTKYYQWVAFTLFFQVSFPFKYIRIKTVNLLYIKVLYGRASKAFQQLFESICLY